MILVQFAENKDNLRYRHVRMIQLRFYKLENIIGNFNNLFKIIQSGNCLIDKQLLG